MICYGRIQIPRISGNFGACTDSVFQALLSPHEREPGFKASTSPEEDGVYLRWTCTQWEILFIWRVPVLRKVPTSTSEQRFIEML